MATLYEINQKLLSFEHEIDPETGELINAMQWEDLTLEYADKVENIACYIKNIKSDIEDLKAEEKNLAERRRIKENRVKYLQKLLLENMDGQKFETAKCAISFRKSTACVIEDETEFIEAMQKTGGVEYLKFSAPTINKIAVKDALKSGIELQGAELVENKSVVIK